MEYYLAIKGMECPCYNVDEPQNCLSERSQTQSHVLCDSIHMKYLEQINP